MGAMLTTKSLEGVAPEMKRNPGNHTFLQTHGINFYRMQTKLREGNVFTPLSVSHFVYGGCILTYTWAGGGSRVCGQGMDRHTHLRDGH